MEHVLLCAEVDTGGQLGVNLLLELVFELLGRLHAVLGGAEDGADPALLLLRQLGYVAALLQDTLNQARGRGQRSQAGHVHVYLGVHSGGEGKVLFK